MTAPVGSHLFAALADSLAEFGDRLAGDAGRRVSTIGRTRGAIPDLIRGVLRSLADALAWLGGALHDAAEKLVITDAVVALVEVSARAIKEFARLTLVGGPELLSLPTGPLGPLCEAVQEPLAAAERLTGYLLAPEDLAASREQIGRLLGARVDPRLTGPGLLGSLLAEVEA